MDGAGADDDCRWSTPSSASPAATRQSTLTPEGVLKLDSEASTAQVSKKKKLTCGFMCQGNIGGRACRKQVSKHNRGAVCPDCMGAKEYLQCSNGCLAYVHVGCIENGDMSWVCLECKNKEPDQIAAVEEAPVDSADDAEAQDYQMFDNFDACHAYLRLRKFRIRNQRRNAQSVVTAVKYSCSHCSAHFIVRHDLKTGNWQVPIGPDHMVGTSFHIIIAVITDPYLS
jgi:hypothetical protein